MLPLASVNDETHPEPSAERSSSENLQQHVSGAKRGC